MPEYQLLKVFLGEDGAGGNLLAVFEDGSEVPASDRQGIAATLGFSETVFVDDAQRGTVEIYTPSAVLPFAGHPLVGTAWLLAAKGIAVDVLHPPAGEVPSWNAEGLTWIRGRPEWSPDFEFLQLDSVEAVRDFDDGGAHSLVDVWSWSDEEAGIVSARVFPRIFGIDEDEATGSAALRLADRLGRPLEIHQGTGSLLFARPGPDGTAEVGGRVELVETREFA